MAGADISISAKPIPGAQVTTKLKRTDVIVGETLAATTLVANKGDQPFSVHVGLSPCELYELRSPKDDSVIVALSQEQWARAMRGARQAPPLQADKEEVQPGKSCELRGDPALYAFGRIPPGQYRLVVRVLADNGSVTSEPVDITVAAARVGRLAALECAYAGAAGIAFDHTDAEGAIWLFQNETDDLRVNSGIFHRRVKLEGEGPLGGLALAIRTDSEGEGRWLAWVRGAQFGAVLGWGNAAAATPKPVALELTEARLVEPGFQMTDGSALFVVAGVQGGTAVVQPVVVSKDGIKKGKVAPLARKLPEGILAHYAGAEGGGKLHLVWAETEGDTSTILSRPYDETGALLTKEPHKLAVRKAKLQAIELSAIAAPETTGVLAHALFGPQERKDAEGKPEIFYTFTRIPLAGALGEPSDHELLPPEGEVSAWAIPPMPTRGRLLVLAKTPTDIVYNWAGQKAEWVVLAKGVKAAQHLSAVTAPSGYWAALWVDPETGVQMAPDPAFGTQY